MIGKLARAGAGTSRLEDVVLRGRPAANLYFRPFPYGNDAQLAFLRDVMAMANCASDGPRLIVVGIELDADGSRRLHEVPEEDFTRRPTYQDLVREFIEPPIQLRHRPLLVSGVRLGVYQLADVYDRPYMMRADHSPELRRGDAWIRVADQLVRLGRSQLLGLLERKLRQPDTGELIEVGFSGDLIAKERSWQVEDVSRLPSDVAAEKLRALRAAKLNPRSRGQTSKIARLVHARLFGPDHPYMTRSVEELERDIENVAEVHCRDDEYYLFGEHGDDLQLVLFNPGGEPVRGASLELSMPIVEGLHVARAIPDPKQNGSRPRRPIDPEDYPSVSIKVDAIHVTDNVGELPPGLPVPAFKVPLRICAALPLAGKRIALHYTLYAENLRRPRQGRLKIRFVDERAAADPAG